MRDDCTVGHDGGLGQASSGGLHHGCGQGGTASHLGGGDLGQLIHGQLDDHRLGGLGLNPQGLALPLDGQLLHRLVQDLLQAGLPLDDHVVLLLLQDDLLLAGPEVDLLGRVALQHDLLPGHSLLDVDLLRGLPCLLVHNHLVALRHVHHLLGRQDPLGLTGLGLHVHHLWLAGLGLNLDPLGWVLLQQGWAPLWQGWILQWVVSWLGVHRLGCTPCLNPLGHTLWQLCLQWHSLVPL